MEEKSMKIAILGAGIVGMTTASMVQDQLRNASVTLIADSFHGDTTSYVAAGIFRPGTSFKGPTKEVTKKWIDDSWTYWQQILRSSDAVNAGLMALSSYILSKENHHVTRNHLIEDLVPIYRPVDEDELKICGDGWKYGSYFSTLKTDSSRFIPWLEKTFVQRGGKIVQNKVESFASLSQYDLIFNCTGLGAKYLCNDFDLVPLRGQVARVKAPWLKTAFYDDYDTYVIPGFNGVATCGGVRQYDSYNTKVCRHDAASIMERCCALLPSLVKAEVVEHKVGLRPHRVPVRVETELQGGLKVVHCYGHGGYGVMCAPGTAAHAVRLGLDYLKINVKNKL